MKELYCKVNEAPAKDVREGGEEMKCPLLCAGKLAVGEITQDTLSDCFKKECAWWDDENSFCGLLTIGKNLSVMSINLMQIMEMMPHGKERLV